MMGARPSSVLLCVTYHAALNARPSCSFIPQIDLMPAESCPVPFGGSSRSCPVRKSPPRTSFDLNAPRLVQFFLGEEGVWMIERDKLIAKAIGKGYLDMLACSFNLITCRTKSSEVLTHRPWARYPKNGGSLTPTQIQRLCLGSLET
ncbi:hypothetical protein B0H17DRAFT_688538 [Mycena rosella]|uniref:Uncharacterized protein n=1 Tax=Mycena rosella TaxID=1033263 RepID=A0AAD7GC38_MYCRO|nr:hypothetical protein B0H17DRAFT_688538 [Mycena rosella]